MTIQKTNIVDQSQMILARLGRVAVPRELDKLVKQLRAEHEALTAVRAATLPAREALRLARLRVHEAEEAADAAVAELANALVLTSIGDRFSPLAVVGAPTPSRIAEVKGLRKRDAVRDVVTRVATLGRVPPSVKKAASSCDTAASELALAVEERDHAEGVLARAVVTRNETQEVFVESLRKLELRARVAWEDTPEIPEAVFAPVRRVSRKRVTKDEPVTPAPDTEVPVVPLPALSTPIHVVPTGSRRLGPAIRGPFVFCGDAGHASGARRSHGHRPCRPRACIAVGPARRPAGSGSPMRLLPFVVPDELVHGAPLALWKALFDVAWPGCDARLRTHDDVLRALASPVPTALSRALGDVLSLGRDPGREALLDALVDRGLDLASFSRTDGATSLALRVVAGAVGAPDGPLAGVVERARAYVHYHDTDERSVLVFRAAERRPLPEDIEARVSRIAGEVAAWCEKYGRLAWAEARSLGPGPGPFGPGTVRVVVRRPDRPTSVPVLDEHGELRVLGGHPLATDALYFDAAGTRFAVATRAPRIAALYRRAAGRALFDEVGYFGNAAVFTLAPLVGLDALRAPLVAAEVSDARVVALGWDTGHNESVRIAGRDCLEAIQRDGHVLAGREISYAKLRVTLVNGRRTSLELWPPHRARLPRGNEDVAWRLIEALRLTRGAGEAADVWALDPWVHARATWAALAGNVEELISEDVLVATQRRVAAHPAHPAAGRALLALPLETEPGSFYGVSLLADVPSRTLAPGELDALALDPLALGRRFARAGGLTGRVREIARYGVYDLGTRPLGSDARVRLLLVLRDPRRDAGTIAADLTERFARDRVVALVPRGRSAGLGVPELAFDGLAPPGDLVPALASALHIDATVDPLLVAPSTARLVLDARGQRAWLDGVLLARLTDLHVKLLLALARSGGDPVSGKDLDAKIAPRRGGGVARDAKYLLGETVRKSFELVGKAPPADTDELIVRVGKKGYRLGVDAFVLSASAPAKAR